MKSAKENTSVSAATLPRQQNTPFKGNSHMNNNPTYKSKLGIRTKRIYFPNHEQTDLPFSARVIKDRYSISPHYAKLIAEHQGYDLGGA